MHTALSTTGGTRQGSSTMDADVRLAAAPPASLLIALLAWIACLAFPMAAGAQQTIADRNAVSDFDVAQGGQYNWFTSGVDDTFNHLYYVRVGGDPSERSIYSLVVLPHSLSDTNPGVDPRADTLSTGYADQGRFQVFGTHTLRGGAPNEVRSNMEETLTIRNLSNAVLTFSFFRYSDFDLNSTAGGDQVEIAPGSIAWQRSNLTNAITRSSPLPTRTQVDYWPSLLESLIDGAATTLSNAGGLIGPGDVTWAFQWDFSLGPGQDYIIRICTGMGDTAPVVGPTNIQASDLVHCLGINVSWTRVPGASSYNIYRNTVNDAGSAVLVGSQSGAGSNYFDTTAPAGIVHYYWVTAVNLCSESPRGTSDTGWWANQPPPPANVAATDGTTCDVTITWTREPTATLYVVYRNTVNEPLTSSAVAVISDGSITRHVDTTAAEGVTYFYWVRSSNGCAMAPGYGTPDTGSRAPGSRPPPTIFNASDGTGCNVVVTSWSTVLNVTGYEVLRAPVNDSTQALPIGTSTTNSFIDVSLNVRTGDTFHYWVRSLNACGAGGLGASNPGFASLPPLITMQPIRATAAAGQSASFTVAAIRATSYEWRKEFVPLTDGGPISGSATPTLTIAPVGQEHAGGYTVLVRGPCGSQQSSPPAILTVRCTSDVDDGSGTGRPDGGVTIDDLLYYLRIFEEGLLAADVDDGAFGGTPDGGVTIDDLLYYLFRFEGGC